MEKAQLVQTIEGLGELYNYSAPLNEQLKVLRDVGIRYPISVRDKAYARLNGGPRIWTRTCHAPVGAKDSDVILVRINPFLETPELAEQLVNAHRKGEYPRFEIDVYQKWEKIARGEKGKRFDKRDAMFLSERGDYKIDKDSREAKFLFQDTKKDYFEKLVPKGVIPLWNILLDVVDGQDGTIVNYMWFDGVHDGSVLDCGDGGLDRDNRAFGVLKRPAEQVASREKGLGYTLKELSEVKEIVDKVKKGEVKIYDLERTLDPVRRFLDTLKQ